MHTLTLSYVGPFQSVSVNSVIHTHSRPGGYEMIVAGQSHGRIER